MVIVRDGLPAKGTADHRWAAGRELLEKLSFTGTSCWNIT